MPRLTNRPTTKSVEQLDRRLLRVFEDLRLASIQLKNWGGATEKISRWQEDIESAEDLVGKVQQSINLILERNSRESLEDYEYSFD